jgi:TRAP transporter TAXI family solute receptor
MWNAATLFLTGVSLAIPQARPDTLVLLTGSSAGSYLEVGQAVRTVIEEALPGIAVRVMESRGSQANLLALGSGEADLAIAQNDIAYHAFRGEGGFQREFGMVEAVMGLHPEDVLVLARSSLDLPSASHINPGMRVVVGAVGSGTLENARDVLDALGLGLGAVDTIMREPRESLHLLATDSADIVFLTAGVSDRFWEEVEGASGKPVSLGSALVEFLQRQRPYYRATTMEVDGNTIHTVRVRALLLASSDLPPNLVYEITKAVNLGLGTIRAANPMAAEILPGTVREYVPIRWHQGASRFYCEAHMGGCQPVLPYFLGSLLLFGIGFIGLWFSQTLRKALMKVAPNLAEKLVGPHGVTDRYKYLVIPVLVSIIILGGALLIQRAEIHYARANNISSQFEGRTTGENLLWTLVFTATGFEEDRFPRSPTAKVLSALLGWVGIGGVILLVGLVTSDRLARKMKMHMSIDPTTLDSHVILCGWNARATEIISKLTDPDLGDRRQTVVVVAELSVNPVEEFALPKDYAVFLKGSPTDLDHMRRAGLDTADTVIVLADETVDDPDSQTVLTVLQVEKHAYRQMVDGERGHELRTVAELVDPQKKSALESVHTDLILCPQEFSEKILLQALLNPGLSQFLGGILSVGGENQIVEVPVVENGSSALVGKTFDEAMVHCRAQALLLLAIHRGGAPGVELNRIEEEGWGPEGTVDLGAVVESRLLTNPHTPEDRRYRIRPGDSLLFLAQSSEPLTQMFGAPGKWKRAFKG